jgi:hypothetical protein
MSSKLLLCMQELKTQGWSIIRDNLSTRLITLLKQHYMNKTVPSLSLIRQSFDGLPWRISTGLIGEVVLSAIKVEPSHGWHRGRNDTVISGAPANFIPGFDLAININTEAIGLEVLSGSGRISIDAPYKFLARSILEIAPSDLVIFDSRLLRCWSPENNRAIFEFSVIRPWLTPLEDFTDKVRPDTPPRALKFYGIPGIPAKDISHWLFKNHQKRSLDARSRS